jgi:hypothetical protein
MLVVNEQVLEIARFTDKSPKIGNMTVSFKDDTWLIEYPPKFLNLTTAGYARLKHSKIPIELGDEALLYFHPTHGLILQER